MHRILGILIGLTIVGFFAAPEVTGLVVASAAALYLVITIENELKYQYHLRAIATATETTARRRIALLLDASRYNLAHLLYRAEFTDDPHASTDSDHQYLARDLCITITVILGGTLIAEGIDALIGPLHRNAVVVILLAVVMGVLFAAGHIIWFRIRAARRSPADLEFLVQNLETIYEPES